MDIYIETLEFQFCSRPKQKTIQNKAGRRTATEGMTTGISGSGKFMWQIWPCGKLYWEAFYRAAGGYRKTKLSKWKNKAWKAKGYTRKRNHSKLLSQQWQIFGWNDENSQHEFNLKLQNNSIRKMEEKPSLKNLWTSIPLKSLIITYLKLFNSKESLYFH